jgi:hypothetical protein
MTKEHQQQRIKQSEKQKIIPLKNLESKKLARCILYSNQLSNIGQEVFTGSKEFTDVFRIF